METSCDPNGSGINPETGEAISINDRDFKPQPLGGTSLIEGSVEYRFAIGMRRMLWAAAFVDGAVVGSQVVSGLSTLRNIVKGSFAVTPGVGIRYKSPVGPIRVDIGFNPARTEYLPVITETVVNGEQRIVQLKAASREYTPAKTLLDRFQLHLSIGQAW
jgi:outer membrane protein assembly factor BamA